MCGCGLYRHAQMRRPFGAAACAVALRKPLTLDEKSAASASDFFAVHWRRLAGLLRITIYSEPFGYARKVLPSVRSIEEFLPRLDLRGLACKERLGGCTQPDSDRLRSWIGTAEHTISKITRPPQTGFHSGRRFEAAFRRFNRGQDRLARGLPADPLLQSLHEWIKRIQHGPIARLRATQFTDGAAALIERIGPLRQSRCARFLQNAAATQKKHPVERP
jgi:hypothetical protein